LEATSPFVSFAATGGILPGGEGDAKALCSVSDQLKYPDKTEKPVLVTEKYAVFLVWTGNEKRFCVYDNAARRTFKTADYDEFLGELGRLPKGVKVQRFDTCTVPRTCDMPPSEWKRLEEVMKSGGREWAVGSEGDLRCEVVCYCESSGFRFP
jgi:hypothetical protein